MNSPSFSRNQSFSLLKLEQTLKTASVCSSENPISYICTNDACQEAFSCGMPSCSTCQPKHRNCGQKLQQLNSIISELSSLIKHKDLCFENIETINNDFLTRIVDTIQELKSRQHNHEFKVQSQEIFKHVYQDSKLRNISGKKANDIIRNIRFLQTHYSQFKTKKSECLIDYQEKINALANELVRFQDELLHIIDPYSACKFEQLQSIIIKQNSKLNSDRLDFIMKSLNHPKSLDLIFRASQHDFRSAAFHKYCDNIEDTFVLIRTEFNKIIAGFTHYKWNQARESTFVVNRQRKTFLLQLDLMKKIVPASDEYLIYCSKQWGPTFGGPNLDLCIEDRCNIFSRSVANFPTAYVCEGSKQFEKSLDLSSQFSGAPKGKTFRVVEYEVFKVNYK